MPSSEPLQVGGVFSRLPAHLTDALKGPLGPRILNDLGGYDDPPVRVGALGLD